jgi:photosystem II stability/assembly factor-like uncharacterized protein
MPMLIDIVVTNAIVLLVRSTDGGRTWRSQPSGTTTVLFGVSCPSPSTCVAVGGDTILRSTDGGRTWRGRRIT